MKSLSATTSTFLPPMKAEPAGRSGVRERPCAPSKSEGDARSPTPLAWLFCSMILLPIAVCGNAAIHAKKPATLSHADADKNNRTGDGVIVKKRHNHRARKAQSSEQSEHHARYEHFRREHQKANDDQNDDCFKRAHCVKAANSRNAGRYSSSSSFGPMVRSPVKNS